MVFVSVHEHGGRSTAKFIYTMDFLLVLGLPRSLLCNKFMSLEYTDLLTYVTLVALADPSSPSLGGKYRHKPQLM